MQIKIVLDLIKERPGQRGDVFADPVEEVNFKGHKITNMGYSFSQS